MILEPIKSLLEEAQISGVDTKALWECLEKAPITMIESLPELAEYAGMEAMPPKTPYTIVVPTSNGMVVSVMFDVVAAGLTAILSRQLGYVPRFAILEWQIAHPQVMMQGVIVCVGNNAINESLTAAKEAVATFSGQPPPREYLEALAQNPLITKTWCYATVEALRTRGMLHQQNIGTNVNPIWMTKIHVQTSSQIH